MVICPLNAYAEKIWNSVRCQYNMRTDANYHQETIMRKVSTDKLRMPFRCGVIGALACVIAGGWASGTSAAEVIELTQVACQFLEPEGKDRGFTSTKKEDCDRINADTGAKRVAESKVIALKPGEYIFRITNKNVPYELGFWLREKDYDWRNPIHKVTKISVSGGGLTTGKSQDYKVTLKPGEYAFSCPLNTTPDYRLVVTGG